VLEAREEDENELLREEFEESTSGAFLRFVDSTSHMVTNLTHTMHTAIGRAGRKLTAAAAPPSFARVTSSHDGDSSTDPCRVQLLLSDPSKSSTASTYFLSLLPVTLSLDDNAVEFSLKDVLSALRAKDEDAVAVQGQYSR
jgi:hypothetical protein